MLLRRLTALIRIFRRRFFLRFSFFLFVLFPGRIVIVEEIIVVFFVGYFFWRRINDGMRRPVAGIRISRFSVRIRASASVGNPTDAIHAIKRMVGIVVAGGRCRFRTAEQQKYTQCANLPNPEDCRNSVHRFPDRVSGIV